MGFNKKLYAVGGVALAAMLAVAPLAHAEDEVKSYSDSSHVYVAVMPGWFYADKDRRTFSGTDNGTQRGNFTMSGILGWQFAPKWQVELNVFGTSLYTSRSAVGTDFYQEGLSIDLSYNLIGDRTGWITPFIIGGVGGVYDDVVPNRYDSVNFQGNAGLGAVSGPIFRSGLLEGLKFRIEARYLFDTFHKGMNDARASLGLELPIGTKTVKTVEVQAPPPPPVIKTVEVPSPPKIIRCPAPFPGAKLDENGCAIAPQTVVLHGVHFEFNKATLLVDAKTLLNQVAEAMKSQKGMTVRIDGHTDDIGSDAYNMKLSQERADSVRAYLMTRGIDGSRMTTKGFGKRKPIVTPQNTAAARELNRRVEFDILTP